MGRILMIPGPTMVDAEVLLAAARPVASHTSPEFEEVHRETLELLRPVFGTQGPVLLLPGSGSLAMEVAARSVVGPGGRALVLRAGHFGGYLERVLRAAGASVDVVDSRVGRGFTRGDLESLLSRSDYDVVAFQHVETSTSVANPLRELAAAARDRGVRVLVDGVASVGGMEVAMDEWGVDVVFTGSQKALAAPPGLAIVAYRSGGEEFLSESRGGVYFDYPRLLAEMESTRNYLFTPSVNLVYALHASLKRIHGEGLASRYRRHTVLAEAVRRGLEAAGLRLVAEEPFRAATVTAAWLPPGVEWGRLYGELRRLGVEVAGGLGGLKGRILRVGHMGEVDANDVVAVLAALERALRRLGQPVRRAAAVEAALEVLDKAGF